MLDRLNQEINTDRVVIPVPDEKPFLFDPQKDITLQDWIQIEKELDGSQLLVSSFARLFFNLKIINPKYQCKKNNIDWENKRVNFDMGSYSSFVTVLLAFCFKVITQKNILKTTDIIELKDAVKSYADTRKWWQSAQLAARLKIFDPNINFEISSKDWEEILIKMKGQLEKYRGKSCWDFALLGSWLKILDPKTDFGIKNPEWKKMREELQTCRETNKWYDFAELASALTILSAKNIVFDNEGMHLVFEEKEGIVEKIPPVPRTF